MATRPIAIGLVRAGAGPDAELRQTRIQLALFADREGYALVEVFQLRGPAADDASVLAAVEQLALQLDAEALLIGPATRGVAIDQLADQARLLVREFSG